MFLLGGNPGVADAAAARLQAMYPRLGEVGFYCPPFGFEDDPEELSRIREHVAGRRAGPGPRRPRVPPQERVIRALRPRAARCLVRGVGISLSFIAGDQPRAPVVLQRIGLGYTPPMALSRGWLFRRYVVHGIPFSTRLFGWALKRRLVGNRNDQYGRSSPGADEGRLTCSCRSPGRDASLA